MKLYSKARVLPWKILVCWIACAGAGLALPTYKEPAGPFSAVLVPLGAQSLITPAPPVAGPGLSLGMDSPAVEALDSSYETLTSGRCDHPVVTIEECKQAAKLLKLGTQPVERIDGGSLTAPNYCYYEISQGRVFFADPSSETSLGGSCAIDVNCVCQRRASPTKADLSKDDVWYIVDWKTILCKKQPVSMKILYPPEGSSPYMPTFLRTSNKSVTIAFEMQDALGKVVVPNGNISLVSMTTLDASKKQNPSDFSDSRRLYADVADTPIKDDTGASRCEQFFLSDERSPVELPDTWDEAADDFMDVCSVEGFENETQCEQAWAALVDRTESHDRDDEFEIQQGECEWLLGTVLKNGASDRMGVVERRLKGYTYRGPNHQYNNYGYGYGYHPPYTYSPGMLHHRYPAGFWPTPYGLAGRHGFLFAAGIPLVIASGCVGASLASASAGCFHSLVPHFNANRDDLLQLGFTPANFTAPFNLTIHWITGEDYLNECNNPNVDQDMLFGLTKGVVEDNNSSTDDDDNVVGAVTLLVMLCCCCFCCSKAKKAFRNRKRSTDVEDDSSSSDSGTPQPVTVPPPVAVGPSIIQGQVVVPARYRAVQRS